MKYERITCVIGGEARVMETKFESKETMQKAVDRLAELEDKIESGKMLGLPCKMKLNISDCNVDVYQIIYSGKYGYMRTEIVYGEVEAEARLKELQSEN